MSIDAGAQVVIILLSCGPCVVILNCLGQVLYLGRAPRTKETMPDFREWCCNTPKYTLVIFDMFRVFCQRKFKCFVSSMRNREMRDPDSYKT